MRIEPPPHKVQHKPLRVGPLRIATRCIAERLREREAPLARAQAINEAWKDLPEQEASESILVGPEQGAFVKEVPELQ